MSPSRWFWLESCSFDYCCMMKTELFLILLCDKNTMMFCDWSLNKLQRRQGHAPSIVPLWKMDSLIRFVSHVSQRSLINGGTFMGQPFISPRNARWLHGIDMLSILLAHCEVVSHNKRVSDSEIWCVQRAIEQTAELSVIWVAWRSCDVNVMLREGNELCT